MLIGACNPMLCPIHAPRYRAGLREVLESAINECTTMGDMLMTGPDHEGDAEGEDGGPVLWDHMPFFDAQVSLSARICPTPLSLSISPVSLFFSLDATFSLTLTHIVSVSPVATRPPSSP